jgi:hypothetical protein
VQGTPADSVRSRGQPSAIIIGQAHAPAAQLAAQAPVFFYQIYDDFLFPAGQPAGQGISSSCTAEVSITGGAYTTSPVGRP